MKPDWLNLVLYRPEIPQNTGNIGRTCVGLGIPLHLIGRPSFSLDEKEVRRAGLDYWENLTLIQYEDFADFFSKHNPARCFFFSKKGRKNLFEAEFQRGDTLIFGQETRGLPEEILLEFAPQTLSLPMGSQIRSYNLSNAAAVAAFEAYRQIKPLLA